MKLAIKSGALQVERDGQVLLFTENLHHRVELGHCSAEGFVPAGWATWDDGEVQSLRRALIELYFAERQAYDPLPQREWPDEVLLFLNVEDVQGQPELEPLVTLEEKDLGVKRRYLNSKGYPCQGLYRDKSNQDLLLIRQGQLVERRRPRGGVEESGLWDGCLATETLGPWLDQRGEAINLEPIQWERMTEGRAKLGAFHDGLPKDLHERGLEVEAKGWECRVYPHLRKEGHYKMVCWLPGKLEELLDEGLKETWSRVHPEGRLDWKMEWGALVDQTGEDENKGFKDLQALMEGVPALWVFAEPVEGR